MVFRMAKNKILNKTLNNLSLKFKCSKVLFTIVITLLSIIIAPILFLVLSLMVLFMFLIITVYVVCLPFSVAYSCVTDRYQNKKDGESDVHD